MSSESSEHTPPIYTNKIQRCECPAASSTTFVNVIIRRQYLRRFNQHKRIFCLFDVNAIQNASFTLKTAFLADTWPAQPYELAGYNKAKNYAVQNGEEFFVLQHSIKMDENKNGN